jgi:2-dehydro-3-deoxygluconokinase
MTRDRVVTFGEIMLRLSPPGFERLFQSPTLSATFGGAEANVAVSLAHFGLESVYVTCVPAHAVGDAAVRALAREGVRIDRIVRRGERLGIYFAESGASQRPSTVIYDRAHSAISQLEAVDFNWPETLAGARWLHVSGITPALGRTAAEATSAALEAARSAGAGTSLDLNYRRKLWSEADARAAMRPMLAHVDLLVGNEEDLQSVLGLAVRGVDVQAGRVDPDAYREVCQRVAADFGPPLVAVTLRESASASDNGWSAVLWDAKASRFFESQRYDVRIVDRIGAGDSFVAGLVYGLIIGKTPEESLRFAVAASALKQTIPGDFNRVAVAEVERLVAGDASGRVQR